MPRLSTESVIEVGEEGKTEAAGLVRRRLWDLRRAVPQSLQMQHCFLQLKPLRGLPPT